MPPLDPEVVMIAPPHRPASEDPVDVLRVGRLGLWFGLVLSALLGAALVVPAAKAGITPGVSPVVVLLGWVAFGRALGPRLKRFLAIGQVTGSGGAAVTAGVVFTAPILQILAASRGMSMPPVGVGLLVLGSLAGALLGFGCVGLSTRRFLTDRRLPAPEAVACDRMIRTAVEHPQDRPALGISLIAGLIGGAGTSAMTNLTWLKESVKTLSLRVFATTTPDVNVPIPISAIYLGIGALLTLPTAILIFAGGLVNSLTQGYASAHGLPATTFRWVGGAAMTVSVLYSLTMYVIEGRKKSVAVDERSGLQRAGAEAAAPHPSGVPIDMGGMTPFADWQLEQSPGIKRMLWGCVAAGTTLMLCMMAIVGASASTLVIMGAIAFPLAFLLSGLGGLLSLQVGSSASPVSGTVFMGLLVLSLAALVIGLEGMGGVAFLVPVVVATCVAICAANDSSQDYKTIQLNGFKVSDSFFGHLLGLLAGAIVVPLTLAMAHRAYGLGSADLPCPQAAFFSTVLESLFLKAEIPWGPVGVGAALGVAAVVMDALGKARGVILSSLAFSVGIYLRPEAGVGMMMGALARWLPKRKMGASTHEGVLVAAGLITGAAIFELGFGVSIMAGLKPPPDDAPARWGAWLGALLLGIILALIYRNNAKGRAAGGG
jgi:uncharacterized oligopeptide transporter (OPT) family protein